MPEARWWRTLADGRVQCDLCPRRCRLREGQRGFCFVRQNVGGELQLTTYGRSSGFAVDPVEKKPLYHFLPGSRVLSFGTAGCNLACKFCQNWEMSTSREFDSLSREASPLQIAEDALRLGCDSVAFTYNDPIIFAEYAIDTAHACRAVGVRPIAVSAGYIEPAPARELYGAMDGANIDLKGFTEEFYRKITGGRLEVVLGTLKAIRDTDCWLEVTTLLIPGLNDSENEIREMTSWVVENLGPQTPHHFSAFHPTHRMQDRPRTPAETLIRAREIAMEEGEQYAYTGNIYDPEGQSTYCPQCRAVVIWRDRFMADPAGLTVRASGEGACAKCGAFIAGVFEHG